MFQMIRGNILHFNVHIVSTGLFGLVISLYYGDCLVLLLQGSVGAIM